GAGRASGGAARRRGPPGRHGLDAVDDPRAQAVGLTHDVDVGQPAHQLGEHDPDLPAGEVRPEAEVRAGPAEADVVVGGPADVEAVRVLEGRLVAVAGPVPHDD